MGETRVLRRLEWIALQQDRPDRMLSLLIAISAIPGGLKFPIGLLVDGVVVRGGLTAPERFAESVDQAIGKMIVHLSGPDPKDDYASLRVHLDNAFAKAVEKNRASEKEAHSLLEKYDPDLTFDQFSDEDADLLLRHLAPDLGVDLSPAQIFIAGEWVDIGTMRIRLPHVGAWWALEEESDLTVDYGPPPGDDNRIEQ